MHFGFHGGIAPRIQDLAADDNFNCAHGVSPHRSTTRLLACAELLFGSLLNESYFAEQRECAFAQDAFEVDVGVARRLK
jgi:hypothetical protein